MVAKITSEKKKPYSQIFLDGNEKDERNRLRSLPR
jgi:hypothetical protein